MPPLVSRSDYRQTGRKANEGSESTACLRFQIHLLQIIATLLHSYIFGVAPQQNALLPWDIHCSPTERSLNGWSLVMLRRESDKFGMNHRQRAQTSLLRKTYPEKLSVGRDLCSFRATRCRLSPGISHHSFSPCSRVPEKEIVRTQGTYEPSSNDSPVLTHDSLFFSLVLLV